MRNRKKAIKKMPRVSVVIPAYNAAAYLAETLESVHAQTFQDLEILVIDDGSTDETADIAAKYTERVVSTSNQGVAAARNLGIKLAQGDLIAFLDSDDIWEPDKLALQLQATTPEYRLVYSDMISFGFSDMQGMKMSDGKKQMPQGNILTALIEDNFITTSSVLLDRNIALQVPGFSGDLAVGEDWQFWIECARLTGAAYVDKTLVRYRIRQGSLSTNLKKRLSDSLSVIDYGISTVDLNDREKRQLRNRARAASLDYITMLATMDDQYLRALAYACRALVNQPNAHRVKAVIRGLLGKWLIDWLGRARGQQS